MEDFDEMPVDAQFFHVLGGTNIQLNLDSDPLSVPVIPPPPRAPPQPRVVLPPPPRPPLPVPIRPSPGIPPQYRSMPITTFAQEMERNLHDIIYESIYLFQRDPLTYHPFYLRLYKYITIGQHLGYVSVDPSIVLSIWQGFSTFADDQYQKMRYGLEVADSLNFTGERSPYANYLLTGKVIIEGRELPQKRNKEERDKLMRKLEEKGNLMKIQWRVKNGRTLGGGGGLRGDLGVRLKFFEECKAVTFPGDVEEMNKLWSGFLGVVEGEKSGPRLGSPPKTMRTTPNILRRKTAVKSSKTSDTKNLEEPIVIKLEPDEDDDKLKDKVKEEEDKESRHALRRIMIKVIVVPPSSTSKGSEAALSPPPSPPPSPPSYSPPPSPSHGSPPPSPSPPPSTKVVPSTSTIRRPLRKLKRAPRRKAGGALPKKPSFGEAILRKKRKKIFQKVTSKISLKTFMLERQLKLEKLINKEKLVLPEAKKVLKARRKKLMKKLNASSDLIDKQLKLVKRVSKPKGRKIVTKEANKKVVAGISSKLAPKKVNKGKGKKKVPLKTAVNGRRKRKISDESEEEDDEDESGSDEVEEKRIEVPATRRSARQSKLKYKDFGDLV